MSPKLVLTYRTASYYVVIFAICYEVSSVHCPRNNKEVFCHQTARIAACCALLFKAWRNSSMPVQCSRAKGTTRHVYLNLQKEVSKPKKKGKKNSWPMATTTDQDLFPIAFLQSGSTKLSCLFVRENRYMGPRLVKCRLIVSHGPPGLRFGPFWAEIWWHGQCRIQTAFKRSLSVQRHVHAPANESPASSRFLAIFTRRLRFY